MQFDSSANPEFHLAGSKPLPAFFRLGEVRPHAFDRSRQNAFEAERAGFGCGFLSIVRLPSGSNTWTLIVPLITTTLSFGLSP